MPVSPTDSVCDQLAVLRAELVEQAYALERQGRLDAADVAIALSNRLGEFCVGAIRDGRRLNQETQPASG
jgi:hypothetical protein